MAESAFSTAQDSNCVPTYKGFTGNNARMNSTYAKDKCMHMFTLMMSSLFHHSVAPKWHRCKGRPRTSNLYCMSFPILFPVISLLSLLNKCTKMRNKIYNNNGSNNMVCLAPLETDEWVSKCDSGTCLLNTLAVTVTTSNHRLCRINQHWNL